MRRIQILRFIGQLKRISFPGFDKIPLWDIVVFFWKGLINGAITTRASAIAFNFFLSVFPMILFLFSLIPYVPVPNFQQELLQIFMDILPTNTYAVVSETITEIILRQRFDILSLGFVSMLVFATNGVNSLLSAFGATYHSFKGRNWINQYFISMLLVCLLSILIIVAVSITIFSRLGMNRLVEMGLIAQDINYYLLIIAQYLVVFLLFFTAISLLYYFAPSKRGRFRLVSAGASFATLLMILSSTLFSYYINHFGQYNKLYGSIGTLMIIMLWFYINALALLVGFELNASIRNVNKKLLAEVVQGEESHI